MSELVRSQESGREGDEDVEGSRVHADVGLASTSTTV